MGSLPIVHRRKIWGNITKVFVDDSFRIVARTLQFCFRKSLVRISLVHFAWRNPSKRVLGSKTGNDPRGFVNKDLSYVSLFLPKTMGNDPMPCGFVYVIAPLKMKLHR